MAPQALSTALVDIRRTSRRLNEGVESFSVYDANGVCLATIGYRNDMHQWKWTHGYLTPDEARRIAQGITRLPEFLMQRHSFMRVVLAVIDGRRLAPTMSR